MSNTINIGLSALTAAQAGITTAGKNIANAGVVGYSRQKVIQGQEAGSGDGTEVKGIERIYDSFLVAQQSDAQSKSSQLQVQLNSIQLLNDYLGDSTLGISPAIQNTLNSLQDISVAPTDIAARQGFLNNLSNFVNTFNDAQSFVTKLSDNIDTQIKSAVVDINTLATQIAKINSAILVAQSQGKTNTTNLNDLYDKRDQLVGELSKLTNVKVYNNNDIYDVLIGTSQSLVKADQVSKIQVDKELNSLSFNINGQVVKVSPQDMSGGVLQGYFDFKSGVLSNIKSQLGSIGFIFADALNQYNIKGKDLDGSRGNPIFDIISDGKIATHLKLRQVELAAASSSYKADNSNVIAMIEFFQKPTSNPVSSYAALVSYIGSKTKELTATTASSKTILQNAQTAVQNVSGVNLDEEAADLVKYQQAYQAAAKLIEISKTLFDTLMSLS